MIKRFLIISLWISATLFGSSLQAQIVPVGQGSYTKTFPGTDASGRNKFPTGSPQLSGPAVGKPVPTNDWWSKVVKEDHADNLFNYPMTLKTTNNGLVVSYIPWGVIDDQQPIEIGVSGLNASKTTVSNYSDWTVTMDWNNLFQATSGIGMPFLYFEKDNGVDARVTINLGSVTVSDEVILVTDARNGADFAIYAPIGSTWTQEGSVYTSSLNGKNYWSLAMLPQDENPTTVAEEYKKYAYVFPTNTAVQWSYDESNSVLRTDFTVTTDIKEGSETNILQGLLPHQWGNLASNSPQPQLYSYTTVRGELKTLEGNSFSVENTFHGILPTLPYLANYSEGFNLADLNQKVKLLENDGLASWTDSYNEGQVMNRLIQTARIADKMGNTEARDKMIATVKERLEDWLTADGSEVAFIFYYNQTWSALLGYPAGHGQDSNINDHHFHWGYFIHAASFMEQFEPGWASQWGPMVNQLVKDAAGEDRNDTTYPFLRNFSPYAGHCWANGFASFPQGNDQESTSESMQFNSSLIHWGSITGDDAIRDLGIYLYTTEQSAVEEYWFDVNEQNFQPSQPYSLVSRVWGNSYDNGTFWTNDIEASYGIELYPIHGGSMYLGHNTQYAEKLWAEIETNTGILNNDDNVNLWHDTMWKYLAFTDPQKAIDLYDSYPDRNLKFGVSDAQTYYWLHAMKATGKVDISITADHPLAVVFDKNGVKTYVAHNYSGSAITVTYSDGFSLEVPAQSMATNLDSDVSGTISSSFASVYPGGSVNVAVEITSGTASRVEFYRNGELIDEDLAEPFEITAENLTNGVYDFYAKVYEGSGFNVTNIISVVSGSQQSYNGNILVIPGSIEAGHYDSFAGGSAQGISYLDTSPGNNGDFRPTEDVDATMVTNEGATIGWISPGEWVEYTVNVEQSGVYDLSLRFASGNQSGGGPIHLELDGNEVINDINLNYTGDWDDWQSKTVTGLEIPEGTHLLRVVFEQGEFNLGRMTFTYKEALSYGPPVANAGQNVTVIQPATEATLDGSGSLDPDGDPMTYLWTQVNGPSLIQFSDNTIESPDISNLVNGIYTINLTVTDNAHSSSDEVLVIVSETGNTAPTIFISAPEDNTTLEEGADINIIAVAEDLEGAVTLVEFFDGATKLGEDNNSPFSFLYLAPAMGKHQITAIATDEAGAKSTSSPINVEVFGVQECSQISNEAREGSFTIGYVSTFKTVGTDVTITFELLDTDKTGVVAFLQQENPFVEQEMTDLGNNTFSTIIRGLQPASTISYACKFAFAGGLATSKYIQYQVGSTCDSNADIEAPQNFVARVDIIDTQSVDILVNATDNSGTVYYEVFNGATSIISSGASGEQKRITIGNLQPGTTYDFNVTAKDARGNSADNNPIIITVETITDGPPVLGLNDDIARSISTYPNPVSSILTLSYLKGNVPTFESFVDLSGKSHIVSVVKSDGKLLLDLRQIPKGVYFVILATENGPVFKKVVKD